MNCPYCHTPNEQGLYYCKNCRQPLYYYPQQQAGQAPNPYAYQQPVLTAPPASDRGVLVLSIFTFWKAFMILVWLGLEKLIMKPMRENASGETWKNISSIYNIVNWTTDILSLLLVIALCIITKNKMARITLIVFESIALVVSIIYKLTEH